MVDRISQAEGIVMNTIQSKALLGIGAYSFLSLSLSRTLYLVRLKKYVDV